MVDHQEEEHSGSDEEIDLAEVTASDEPSVPDIGVMLEEMGIAMGRDPDVPERAFDMPPQGDIGRIDLVNNAEEITPFTINLDENIGNVIGRATSSVRSDRFDLVLKDGTVLDPQKTLREAGVKFSDVLKLVERDSGLGSDNDSISPERSEITPQDMKEIESTLKNEDLDELLDVEMQETGSIIVTDTDGNINETIVNKSDLIDDIIYKLTDTRDNGEFELYDGTRVLPRNISLRDAGIRFGSNLRLSEREVNVIVHCVKGSKPLNLPVRRSSPVRKLKERYFEERQVPPHQQRLQFQSKPLEDDKTLRSYGIQNNSHVESTYRLRGGAN